MPSQDEATIDDGTVSRHGLIVDVGMHRGQDTAFYLAKGFTVLAIEANPQLVEAASARFASDIRDGRLEILNVAIADQKGTIDFFVSEREGWGSARKDWADSRAALGIESHVVTVPAETVVGVMAGRERPHYMKIDIEGADAACVRALADAPKPSYLSVECDPMDQTETLAMIDHLVSYGYSGFKLINQALNPEQRPPNPPREGIFADTRFDEYSSGLFGEETPGVWLTSAEVRDLYLEVSRRQRVRSSYTSTGKVFGVPLGRFHRQLEAIYNARPVRIARRRWASLRGTELGGWFDLHAALGKSDST